jgi:hypothetical protein
MANERAGHPQPSDQPGGRSIPCKFQPFCKKVLDRPHLSGNFVKKYTTFLQINPQSNLSGSEKIAKKTLSFHKINPPS